MNNTERITVTSPLLPDIEEFNSLLMEIWDSKWITNNGDFHKQLEAELCKYLKVPYISLFTNGTLPLITALQALNITGEVILVRSNNTLNLVERSYTDIRGHRPEDWEHRSRQD